MRIRSGWMRIWRGMSCRSSPGRVRSGRVAYLGRQRAWATRVLLSAGASTADHIALGCSTRSDYRRLTTSRLTWRRHRRRVPPPGAGNELLACCDIGSEPKHRRLRPSG